MDQATWENYIGAVQAAILVAREERGGELTGERMKWENGVHPFSAAWGRVSVYAAALHDEITEAPDQLAVSPYMLRRAGAEDAMAAFIAALDRKDQQ